MGRRGERWAAWALGLIVTAAAVVGAVAAADPAPAPATPELAPVHSDAAIAVDAARETIVAIWLEDAGRAEAALERLTPATRLLDPVLDEGYGDDALAYSRAMRTTILRTRDELSRGDMAEALNMFVWTQRSCMGCHAEAREIGLTNVPGANGPEAAPAPGS